jgi:uncharacterized protein (UPF0333 family)
MPRKALSTILVAFIVTAMTAFASFAASEFEGVWAVKDTHGAAFDITLAADGKANATHPKGMVGTWKEEGSSAVITWDSGWTTKITKDGDHFVKTSFKKGEPLDGKPTNTSDAQKK